MSASTPPATGEAGGRRKSGLLGVLGGMGPSATAHFYLQLIALTPAAEDQAHVPVLIWADPRVPDRSAALVANGESPVPALVAGTRWLKSAGADIIAVPCNTAHAFLGEVSRRTGATFLDMPSAAIADACVGQASAIGVLATRGTRQARIYEKAAHAHGAQVLQVSEDSQRDLVDQAIAEVKSSGDRRRASRFIAQAAAELAEAGADSIIAGCTEIPLVADDARLIVPVIDSSASLAAAALRHLGFALLEPR